MSTSNVRELTTPQVVHSVFLQLRQKVLYTRSYAWEHTPHTHAHTQLNATVLHMCAHQSGPGVHPDQVPMQTLPLPAHPSSGMPKTPSGRGQCLTDELTPLKHGGSDQTEGEA